jgi:hypothetical protein
MKAVIAKGSDSAPLMEGTRVGYGRQSQVPDRTTI